MGRARACRDFAGTAAGAIVRKDEEIFITPRDLAIFENKDA